MNRLDHLNQIKHLSHLKHLNNLRVAVVHDWMFSRRGGEKVLENILNLFPQADLFLLFGTVEKVLKTRTNHQIKQSFLATLPRIEKYYKMLLPLFPLAAESHDLSGYDLIISSSSCTAKGVIPPPQALHVCYMHSPMRYAWDMENTYFTAKPGFKSFKGIVALIRKLLLSRLRIWDVTSSQRIDVLCCNSSFVARRAKLYYGRKAKVIFPPVDLRVFSDVRHSRPEKQSTILLFGAWVPYKKMELALQALVKKQQNDPSQNVKIIAAGQGDKFLEIRNQYSKLNAPHVEFVLAPSDSEVPALFKRSHVLAYPGIEDFGIVPVEAMAAGVWVVAPDQGGTAETVRENLTGFCFKAGNLSELVEKVWHALELNSPPPTLENLEHIRQFSSEAFDEKFSSTIENALAQML